MIDPQRILADDERAEPALEEARAALLGVDDARSDEFVGWVRAILEQGGLDPEGRIKARTALLDFFAEQVADLGFDIKSLEIPDPPRLAAG